MRYYSVNNIGQYRHIIRSMNCKYGSCRFSAKNLQTDVYNLNTIITSTNKNVPAVYKTRIKHGTFIERKTNTAMKASVINEILHCMLTDSETPSSFIRLRAIQLLGSACELCSIKQEVMPICNISDIVNSPIVMIAWKSVFLSALATNILDFVR